MNADGTMRQVTVMGQQCHGRQLMQRAEYVIRRAFQADAPRAERHQARDYFWYLWCGPDSPLFDKSGMRTFERYLLSEKELQHEEKGAYYQLRNNPQVCAQILDEFQVTGHHRHIINGHVPVHVAQGESPIRADGMLMVIDGGFSKGYHETTGIAGYTLVYHSRGFELIQHEPFTSTAQAIENETDIISSKQIVELRGHRLRVRETDIGRRLQQQVDELRCLLHAYQHDLLKERKH